MRRVAIAIGVVVILAAGVALWALTRSGGGGGPRGADTARVQRGADQEKGVADGPSPSGQTPEASPESTEQGRDAERGEKREQAGKRDQAGAADRNKNGRAPAPGDGPGDWKPPSEMSDAERARMREQMLERMLDQADLTDKETAAVRKTMDAKQRARQALSDRLTDLRRIANKSKPTDKELRDALTAYRAAVAQYRKKVEAEDQALAKQLSARAQARCLSLGILENGLGGFGRGGPGGPRPPR